MIKRWKCFSKILLRIGSKDFGLNSLGLFAPCLLGIGTTLELFHAVGGRPSWIERLKSLVMEGAITAAVSLNIQADMPSFPLALSMLSDCNKTTTSSSVHRMLELHSDAGLLLSSSGNGGSESLKQLEKKEFRTFALSSSES